MRLPVYQVDAFTDRPFAGNPAAVVPLDAWLPDSVMQAVAMENNLSETAFFTGAGGEYRLRWFTPAAEVDLCGHATLATAFVLFGPLGYGGDVLRFTTKSGGLAVTRDGEGLAMNFPSRPPAPCAAPPELARALGALPEAVLRSGRTLVGVFDREEDVRGLAPDMALVAALDCEGLVVTAPGGGGVDFVSRCFAPAVGVPEDPVTGSAHCVLTPYWAARLGKQELLAHQVSARGGEIACRDLGERVALSGRAVLTMEGTIIIEGSV